MAVNLYEHQKRALEKAAGHDRVALYHDCGLGKSFSGAELLDRFGNQTNLVVCQKSMLVMWENHFRRFYPKYDIFVYRTKSVFVPEKMKFPYIIIINYDMLWRRPDLLKLHNFTLLLDESSLIQHNKAKRTKTALKLRPSNVILLSGTPCSGKYENLLSQCKLLGWKITKKEFWERYVISEKECFKGQLVDKVVGYKNIEDLKRNLRMYGAQFLKTDAVFDDMPKQNFIKIQMPTTNEYKIFKKSRIVEIDGRKLVGDTALNQILYERMLCSQWNTNKLDAFADIIDSTDDRLVVFYNFNEELVGLANIALKAGRPISLVNGIVKNTVDFDNRENAIIFVQFTAGSMGLNLQAANKMIFYSLTLSCEKYQQAQKRIHRIGQTKPCFYYILEAEDSIDQWVRETLERGIDFTEKLFLEKQKNQKKN